VQFWVLCIQRSLALPSDLSHWVSVGVSSAVLPFLSPEDLVDEPFMSFLSCLESPLGVTEVLLSPFN